MRMTSKAIDVTAASAFGRVVPVTIRVAIEKQVVRSADAVDADRLAVVDAQLFENVVAAAVLETFGLGVPCDRHLHAGHFDALEMDPRPVDLKRIHAQPRRL